MIKSVKEFFKVNELGSSLRVEFFAGLSTFLSLSYIFVVNPSILTEAGIDKSVAFFATVLISALATIVMGLWANKPFSLAPGLEMNAYVAFVVVGLTIFPSWNDFKTYDKSSLAVIIAMVLVTIWSFGLDKAMLAGFGLFILLQIMKGQWKEVNPYLAVSTFLLLASIYLA